MLFDTYAWIEYFVGSPKGRRVAAHLDSTPTVYTCPMVLAEVASKYVRAMDSATADRHGAFILENAAIVEHTADIGHEAGRIHAEMKPEVPDFGMADAFVLAAARSRDVTVLTGDPHFETVEDAEMLGGG